MKIGIIGLDMETLPTVKEATVIFLLVFFLYLYTRDLYEINRVKKNKPILLLWFIALLYSFALAFQIWAISKESQLSLALGIYLLSYWGSVLLAEVIPRRNLIVSQKDPIFTLIKNGEKMRWGMWIEGNLRVALGDFLELQLADENGKVAFLGEKAKLIIEKIVSFQSKEQALQLAFLRDFSLQKKEIEEFLATPFNLEGVESGRSEDENQTLEPKDSPKRFAVLTFRRVS